MHRSTDVPNGTFADLTTSSSQGNLVMTVRGAVSDQAADRAEDRNRAGRIARVLVVTTVVRSVGRGIFITVMTLYLTRFLGASVTQAGMVITAGSLAGVAGSFGFGRLSDRRAPRPVLVTLMVMESVAFCGFALAPSYLVVLPFALVLGSANLGGSAVRSVVIAREFVGSDRVATRGKMYMAANVGIGVGGSVGALALVSDAAAMSKVVLASASVMYVVAAAGGLLLPRGAGAPAPGAREPAESAARIGLRGDRRFLAVTALSSVLGVHLALIEVGMPLWVTLHTRAPRIVVTLLLVLNTLLVIVLQPPVAGRSLDPRRAGRLVLGAALALTVGNVLMWSARFGNLSMSLVLLVAAVVAWTIGEVSTQAGTWTLSFELTPPDAAGAYQGFFTMGWHVGVMLGPLAVTSLAISHGLRGWLALSCLLLGAGGSLFVLAHRIPGEASLARPAGGALPVRRSPGARR
jgi:MFS family permease